MYHASVPCALAPVPYDCISWYKGPVRMVQWPVHMVQGPVMHGTGSSVPYDRISLVRIPPLLSGAALTLHPPSNTYHDHDFHSALSQIWFSPSIPLKSNTFRDVRTNWFLLGQARQQMLRAETMKRDRSQNSIPVSNDAAHNVFDRCFSLRSLTSRYNWYSQPRENCWESPNSNCISQIEDFNIWKSSNSGN